MLDIARILVVNLSFLALIFALLCLVHGVPVDSYVVFLAAVAHALQV